MCCSPPMQPAPRLTLKVPTRASPSEPRSSLSPAPSQSVAVHKVLTCTCLVRPALACPGLALCMPLCPLVRMALPTWLVVQAIISNPPCYGHVHVAEKLQIPLHLLFTMPWTPTKVWAGSRDPLAVLLLLGAPAQNTLPAIPAGTLSKACMSWSYMAAPHDQGHAAARPGSGSTWSPQQRLSQRPRSWTSRSCDPCSVRRPSRTPWHG